jgi:hypothetical protein
MNAGKIGIYRPYLEVPRQQVSSENVKELYQQMLQDIRSYFREMNVSEQLADAMLPIERDKVRLLNDAALVSYGLTSTDPIEQETEDFGGCPVLGGQPTGVHRKITNRNLCRYSTDERQPRYAPAPRCRA